MVRSYESENILFTTFDVLSYGNNIVCISEDEIKTSQGKYYSARTS